MANADKEAPIEAACMLSELLQPHTESDAETEAGADGEEDGEAVGDADVDTTWRYR